MVDEDVTVRVGDLQSSLRAWFGAFGELNRQFAHHVGMHSSDATALVHITTAEDRDAPLSQVQLSRRLGLSPAATSNLLSRLESAGHIERHRGESDRRTVTLRATAAVHDDIRAFFQAVGSDLDALAATYSDDVLLSSTGLIRAMTDVLDRHLASSSDAE